MSEYWVLSAINVSEEELEEAIEERFKDDDWSNYFDDLGKIYKHRFTYLNGDAHMEAVQFPVEIRIIAPSEEWRPATDAEIEALQDKLIDSLFSS